jgi:hypothetical protein
LAAAQLARQGFDPGAAKAVLPVGQLPFLVPVGLSWEWLLPHGPSVAVKAPSSVSLTPIEPMSESVDSLV